MLVYGRVSSYSGPACADDHRPALTLPVSFAIST
jgi:hypothetical protein